MSGTKKSTVEKFSADGGDQAQNWLRQAVRHIDEDHGEGFAAAHPQLVAAMVQASALHYHASWLARALEHHALALDR